MLCTENFFFKITTLRKEIQENVWKEAAEHMAQKLK
jgi:hypothetical protein